MLERRATHLRAYQQLPGVAPAGSAKRSAEAQPISVSRTVRCGHPNLSSGAKRSHVATGGCCGRSIIRRVHAV